MFQVTIMVLKVIVKFIATTLFKQSMSAAASSPVIQARMVQRLSETFLIRRAARFTAYLYLRGRAVMPFNCSAEQINFNLHLQALEEGVKHEMLQSSRKGANSFKDKFGDELNKGWKELQEEIKKQGGRR